MRKESEVGLKEIKNRGKIIRDWMQYDSCIRGREKGGVENCIGWKGGRGGEKGVYYLGREGGT